VSSLDLNSPTATTNGAVTARLALARGARYAAADHRIGIMLVDPSGRPLGIDYTNQVTGHDPRGDVTVARLTVPAGTSLPRGLRAYVLADVFPLYSKRLIG
jgi:hypothetical protein